MSTSSSRRSNTGTACEHAEVDQPGLLDAGDHLDRRRPPRRAPARGTRGRWPPRGPRSWRRRGASASKLSAMRLHPASGRRCPRSMRVGRELLHVAAAVSRGGRPPARGSASRSGRRRPGGRRRGGSCWCRCRAPRALARGQRPAVGRLGRRQPLGSRRGTSAGR